MECVFLVSSSNISFTYIAMTNVAESQGRRGHRHTGKEKRRREDMKRGDENTSQFPA